MEIVKGWSGIGCRCWIVAKSFIEITSILYSIQKLFKVWKGKYQQKALIQWAFVEGRLEENEFLGLNGSKKSWLLPSLYFIHYSLCVTVPLWALNKVIFNMKLNILVVFKIEIYTVASAQIQELGLEFVWYKNSEMMSWSLVISGSPWLALNRWSHHSRLLCFLLTWSRLKFEILAIARF